MTAEPSEDIAGRYFSREEYRQWCEAQPKGRYERVNGRIFAMAPERAAHARMKASAYQGLRRAVRDAGLTCEVFPDGMTVEVGESDYEPDALVNCGDRIADDAIAAPNPIVVVEVLSPGTKSVDSGAKLADYFRVPSVAHYLIVHPTQLFVIHHRRDGDRIDTAIIRAGAITMDPPGITITAEEIFEAD